MEWYAKTEIGACLDHEERRGLKRFEKLCRHYARLERLVSGEVRFELPAETSALAAMLTGPAAGQGEHLADLERRRLELGDDPLDDVIGLFEEMGIKIVGVRMPGASRIAGGFFFDSDVGPCMLVNSSLPEEEHMISVAHQYCHFLADYNPYLPRLCLRGAPTGEDASEERAAGFAGAFLLPAGSLEMILGGDDGFGTEADALEALGVYFGVPVWAVAHRLRARGVSVDVVAERGWEDAVAEPRDINVGHAGDPGEEALPELPRRIVQLALECRARGLVSPLRMARLLQIDGATADDLYSYFRIGLERLGDMEVPGE